MSNEIVKREMDIDGLTKAATLLAEGNMFPHPGEKRPLNKAEVFSIIEYGHELGMPPVVSLMNVVPVKGRLCVSAACMLGLAVNEGVKYKVLEENAVGCTILFKRGDVEYTSVFNAEDAKRAKLLDKDNWRNYTVDMYKARAISKGCRMIIPDKLAGLYLPEEISTDAIIESSEQIITAPGKPIPVIKSPDAPCSKAQSDAIHAWMNGLGINAYKSAFYDFLADEGIMGYDKTVKGLSKQLASNLIGNFKKIAKKFYANDNYHSEIKDKFKIELKQNKTKYLNKMATLIDELKELPHKITDELTDAQCDDYLSLFLTAISHEVSNAKEDKQAHDEVDGMTSQEVIDEIEMLGMAQQMNGSATKTFF